MRIENHIEQIQQVVCDGDVSWLLKKAFWAGYLLGEFAEEINTFADAQPDVRLHIDEDGIHIQFPENREQCSAFLKAFGGDWQKEVSPHQTATIDYYREFRVGSRTMRLAVKYSSPPPSCQIVEEEVDVPARKEMRRKIVCPKEVNPTEDATIVSGLAPE